MNKLHSLALKIVVSLMAEERHKLGCREMKNKFKKRDKVSGSINGKRRK